MHLVTVRNLTKHYGAKTLFDDVSFSLSDGERIGIVGVNGSGKTTLLTMLTGAEPPDGGDISRNPQKRIAYLPQNPPMADETGVLDYIFAGDAPTMHLLRDYEQAVHNLSRHPTNPHHQRTLERMNQRMTSENGWAAEANAKAILTRLGLTDFQQPLGQLSGGQRRRVALARVLLDPADLLILDEPTNHIDPETIAWLEDYLAGQNGAILMVTHDRYFLDRICTDILEIEGGTIHRHPGNYSQFLANKAHREATRRKQALEEKTFLEKELAWLHRTPMARGGKQQARINRALDLLENAPRTQTDNLSINVAQRRTGKEIITLNNVGKAFDGQTIIKTFSYTVNKKDRLGIIGPNGAGKTTLLNLIAGRLQPDQGEITVGQTIHLGYYDQEGEALNPNQRVLENINELADVVRLTRGEAVSAAQMLERFMFSRPDQQRYISTLSGGERRRLYLLRTLMMAPNVLLLDEPTNDLDIQTLSILEDYLSDFNGVVMVVSHDRYFLDRIADHIFAFEGDGLIRRYPGNYSAYRAIKQAEAARESEVSKSPPDRSKKETAPPPAKSSRNDRLSYKEQREFEALEEKIAALEGEQVELTAAVNQAGDDYQQLQTLSAQLAALETDLETAFERWAELAERAT
jgi:ATP-binding cassette subfamily F protein uup